jgi:hypothetical protein
VAVQSVRDLRGAFGPARNQGSRPTCIAFAVSDVHAVTRDPYLILSPEYLYWHAVRRTPNGHPDDGVALPTALNALLLDGQCAEAGWPYLDPLPRDLAAWTPPATATPVYRRDSHSLGAGIAAIVDRLDAGVPAVATLLLGGRLYCPVNGIITPGPNDADTDYHAVIAVGYGRDGPDWYVLTRNSWGEDWGIDGHAWVHTAYLESRLYRVTLMSDKEIA